MSNPIYTYRNFSQGPAMLLRTVAANTEFETDTAPAYGFIANAAGNVAVFTPDHIGDSAVIFPVLKGRFYSVQVSKVAASNETAITLCW